MSAILTETIREQVHDLESKRSSKRGTVTKLHNRITKALSEGPDRIKASTLQDLATQLSAAIDVHIAVQAQLEESYETFPELRSAAKEAEDTELLDTHVEYRSDVNNVLQALPLRRQAVSLLQDIEAALDAPMPDSTFFRNSVDRLQSRRVSIIDNCTEFYPVLSDLHSICTSIISKMSRLFNLTAAACKEAAVAATTPATTAAPTPTHDRNTLNVELPSYDGDPFKWANFRTMFRQTVDKRATGHTALELKGLLIKAVKHPDGSKLLHNLPSDDVPLDDMLQRLEALYGTPEVLAPLIIRKIKSVTSCGLHVQDLDFVYENLILPYNKFCALVGDSLGSFLALTASNLMSQECRREWLRHRPPNAAPDMENLTKFVELQRRELRSNQSGLLLTTPPSHPSSTTPRPPSPRADQSRPPVSRPPPRRTAPHCIVCGESHSITRCPTFSGYEVDKRNKLVRERKLCLNCLSEGHGCKSCPSKFSCRTCSGRHHSLLHREREAPATTSTTPAPAMTSQAAAPSRGVASLYTAMVAFKCGARTILA